MLPRWLSVLLMVIAGVIVLAAILWLGVLAILAGIVRLLELFKDMPFVSRGGSTVTVQIPYVPETPPLGTSFRQTGPLPMSVSLKGQYSRLHSRQYLHVGKDFYKTFEDSTHTWGAASRYAGTNTNTGHFFGCSLAATLAETEYYGINQESSAMLEVIFAMDSILDLTYEENIDACVGWVTENPQVLGRSYFAKLKQLIDKNKGGDVTNELLGLAAYNRGYSGIRFYSARALRKFEASWEMNPDDPLIYMTEELAFPRMRANRDVQAILIFSGSLLTRSIERYRVDGGEWVENPYHGMREEALEPLQGDSSSLQMEHRWLMAEKIRLVARKGRGRES